jgi:hypothetical protein
MFYFSQTLLIAFEKKNIKRFSTKLKNKGKVFYLRNLAQILKIGLKYFYLNDL